LKKKGTRQKIHACPLFRVILPFAAIRSHAFYCNFPQKTHTHPKTNTPKARKKEQKKPPDNSSANHMNRLLLGLTQR
jgi:hypothetical protein